MRRAARLHPGDSCELLLAQTAGHEPPHHCTERQSRVKPGPRRSPPVRKACRRAASATATPRGDSAPAAAAAAAAVGVLAASGLPKPAWQLLHKCLPKLGRSLRRRGHVAGGGAPGDAGLGGPSLATPAQHTRHAQKGGSPKWGCICCSQLQACRLALPAVACQARCVRPHPAPFALHHVCKRAGRQAGGASAQAVSSARRGRREAGEPSRC